ncbi:MAG: prephenate dehydratase, partial [Planctomycetota bacterium]
QSLARLRERLDELDDRLVVLISERAELARRIGEVKASAGMRVYAPDRERQVLERVCARNRGPIPDASLRSIYRELMSASLALERTPRIAVLGPGGSYSHQAGRSRFGASVEFEMVSSIPAVFDEVERGHVEYALAPIENSIIGGVTETHEALIDRDVTVCGEVHLAIHHHVLSKGPLDAVERIYSKPEVFAQCQRWLMETGFAGKTAAVSSTSEAARRAASEPGTAAIAGSLAAELFDLQRVAEYVEDERGNATRFLIIGTGHPQPTGSDKTSIVFSVGHKPGALSGVLNELRGINLTRIESQPDRRKRWAYFFFVDFEGHAETPAVAETLNRAADRCTFWKVLGAYPRSEEVL